MPSKWEHFAKLFLAVLGTVLGAVLAVYAPAYVVPVAAVISALSGIFGVNELAQHRLSYKTGA